MAEIKASKEEKEVLESYLLQFLNIEKQFPLLPGIRNTKAMANLMGIEEDELKEIRTGFDENARQAALELLEEEDVSGWMDQLPFEDGDTILALGDSLTDDLQGWFSIFSYALEIAEPDASYTFVNSGVSYNTSTEALKRLNRDVLAHEPDWVIVALGTFDAQRLNVAANRTLVPLAEFWENINSIETAVREVTDNPMIWVSPPPVLSKMLDEFRLFEFMIEEEDLLQFREIISGKTGYIVDPRGDRMGDDEPQAWNYLNDGLHPSLSGHSNTVREMIKVLATSDKRQGAQLESPEDFEGFEQEI